MEFANDQHRTTYELVKGWVEQLFGEAAQPWGEERPSFRVRNGSETVFIHLFDGGDAEVWLNLRTWPCDRAKASDNALRRMLEFNAHALVGDLQIEGLGEVEFVHASLATHLTKESFELLFYVFAQFASEARADLKPFVA